MAAIRSSDHTSNGLDPVGMLVLAAVVVVMLVFAFVAGRYTAKPAASSRALSTPTTESLQSALADADRQEQLQQLEKQVANLKKQNADLTRDNRDLENRLSIAADTANKLRLNVQEERRRADDAEWQARQNQSPVAPPAGIP